MSWNLSNNITDYNLNGLLTDELITITGFEVKYIKSVKMNKDKIFTEITHLKSDNESVFTVYVQPENAAGFDSHNDLFSKFGILNMDSIELHISSTSFLTVYPDKQFQNGVGDLLLLPSGKLIEVIDVNSQVNGLNNMFVYDNQKNVYTLKCKPYNYNFDEIAQIQSNQDISDFGVLFDIENKTLDKIEQDSLSKIVKNLDPVFGDLG